VQQTNCHPFRRGRWLFVHNGYIAFHLLRRELMLGIAPELFAEAHGSTDTEVVFHVALTLGLEREPLAALERTVGVIEQKARRHGIAAPPRRPRRFGRRERLAPALRDGGHGTFALRVSQHRLDPRPPSR